MNKDRGAFSDEIKRCGRQVVGDEELEPEGVPQNAAGKIRSACCDARNRIARRLRRSFIKG